MKIRLKHQAERWEFTVAISSPHPTFAVEATVLNSVPVGVSDSAGQLLMLYLDCIATDKESQCREEA